MSRTAVGQPGQRVVSRLVGQAGLEATTLGDVLQGPHEGGGSTGLGDGHRPGHHQPRLPGPVPDPDLGLPRDPADHRLERVAERGHVLAVDVVEPAHAEQLLRRAPQQVGEGVVDVGQAQPGLAAEDRDGGAVGEGPEAVVGALREHLLALVQRGEADHPGRDGLDGAHGQRGQEHRETATVPAQQGDDGLDRALQPQPGAQPAQRRGRVAVHERGQRTTDQLTGVAPEQVAGRAVGPPHGGGRRRAGEGDDQHGLTGRRREAAEAPAQRLLSQRPGSQRREGPPPRGCRGPGWPVGRGPGRQGRTVRAGLRHRSTSLRPSRTPSWSTRRHRPDPLCIGTLRPPPMSPSG